MIPMLISKFKFWLLATSAVLILGIGCAWGGETETPSVSVGEAIQAGINYAKDQAQRDSKDIAERAKWILPVASDQRVIHVAKSFQGETSTTFWLTPFSPVVAPADGVLIYKGPLNTSEFGIVLSHGEGLYSVISSEIEWEPSQFVPLPGSTVTRGQLLTNAKGNSLAQIPVRWRLIGGVDRSFDAVRDLDQFVTSIEANALGLKSRSDILTQLLNGSEINTKKLLNLGVIQFNLGDNFRVQDDFSLTLAGRQISAAEIVFSAFLLETGQYEVEVTSGRFFKSRKKSSAFARAGGTSIQLIQKAANGDIDAAVSSYLPNEVDTLQAATPLAPNTGREAIGPASADDLEAGLAAYQSKDYAKALRLLQPQAERGVAKAQASLGAMYINGWGLPNDDNLGHKWIRLAVAQGDPQGQNSLGYSYLIGRGVEKDYAEAIKYYKLSAVQGNLNALRTVGSMYESGRGVTQNYEEAARWYLKAAAQGDSFAKNKLESTSVMKSAVERVAAADALSTGQKPNTEVAAQSREDQLALEAAASEKLRVAEEARVKEQERLAQIAKAKEQERLAQEAHAREQERLAQVAQAKEQERLTQIEQSRRDALVAARQRDEEVAKLRQQAEKKEQERLAQEAQAQERERLIQAAIVKEQERLAQEAQATKAALASLDVQKAENERLKVEATAANARQQALEKQLRAAETARLVAAQAVPAMREVQAHALVIGNASYGVGGKLANPTNDAKAMSRKLRSLGFVVTEVLDANRGKLVSALSQFSQKSSGADILGIPVDRDRSFRFVVTGDSGSS